MGSSSKLQLLLLIGKSYRHLAEHNINDLWFEERKIITYIFTRGHCGGHVARVPLRVRDSCCGKKRGRRSTTGGPDTQRCRGSVGTLNIHGIKHTTGTHDYLARCHPDRGYFVQHRYS